jgi:hypothetical protein
VPFTDVENRDDIWGDPRAAPPSALPA